MTRVLIKFADGQTLIASIPTVMGYLVVAYPGSAASNCRVRLVAYKDRLPVYEEVTDEDAPATGFIPTSLVEPANGVIRGIPAEKKVTTEPGPASTPPLPPGIDPDAAAARRRKQDEQRVHDNRSVKHSYRIPSKTED